MDFHPFYLGCMAHGSYLIGSEGEAAVIDPQRDVDVYIAEAARRGLQIKYVLETHFHADFVSGHMELAQRTGATIVFGRRAQAGFPHQSVSDGETLPLGRLTLKALETPGHTPESVTWLVIDPDRREPTMAFTGDTLFIGDVGRPDLVGSKGFTTEEMASMMYDSLRTRIMTLPDTVEVWPAHGAGSACGKNISDQRSSTIGEQKRTNWALQPMSKDQFVEKLVADLPPVPSYFPMNAEMNRSGAPPFELHLDAMTVEEVEEALRGGAIIVDAREAAEFDGAHIADSIHIGLSGEFAPWAGTLLPLDRSIVLIAEPDRLAEAKMRLSRVGLDHVLGYLRGGVEAWVEAGLPLRKTQRMTVGALQSELEHWFVLDVRRPTEFVSGHVPGALNIPLAELHLRTGLLDRSRPIAVVCAGGYRSAMAASLLQRQGFEAVADVLGGTAAWKSAGLPVEA